MTITIKTKEQFNLLSKPLDAIDQYMTKLAEDRKYYFDRNYHNWPSRSLEWLANDGLIRKIEISLEDNLITFRIIGYVWYDLEKKRFIKIILFVDSIQPPLKTTLETTVPQYIEELNAINKEDLKLAKA